jgi:hypothetical protein
MAFCFDCSLAKRGPNTIQHCEYCGTGYCPECGDGKAKHKIEPCAVCKQLTCDVCVPDKEVTILLEPITKGDWMCETCAIGIVCFLKQKQQ